MMNDENKTKKKKKLIFMKEFSLLPSGISVSLAFFLMIEFYLLIHTEIYTKFYIN